MKKKIILYSLFLIISLILIIAIVNNFNREEIKYDITFIDSSESDKIVESEKITPHLVKQEQFNNRIIGLEITGEYKRIYLTQNDFSNIIYKLDYSLHYKRKIAKIVLPYLYKNNTSLMLTNAFDKLLHNCLIEHYKTTGMYLSDGLISLKYKALLPYAKRKIHSYIYSTNTQVASMCAGWLSNIQHPDTLRAHLELNRLIPEDSQLRKGSIAVWSDNLPVIFRDDCLPVYLDIIHNPKKYNFTEYRTALNAIVHFTNAVAVAEYKRGIKQIPIYYKNIHPLIIRNMRNRIKYQNDFCTGKKPLIKKTRPLLDE